jgi:AP-3 complex subunit mu
MDSGLPFTTELNILKEMVSPPSMIAWPREKKIELPEELTTAIPWRHVVKYATNEIFFDIIEEMDSVIDVLVDFLHSDISFFCSRTIINLF